MGPHPDPLPPRAPADPQPEAPGIYLGRDRRADRPAPGQRPPHPPHPGPQAGLRGRAPGGAGEPLPMTTSPGPRGRSAPLTPAAAEALAAELVGEMIRRWRQGERPLPEDFLARHPGLREHPQAAADLIYEELSLRQEYGPEVPIEQVLR